MIIDTVIVGAGHAGLAVSRMLADVQRDHVVLDRGRVAERWRSERWDSLHLLTPAWMTRLPGWHYAGTDPDGYLSSGELVQYLERYAASFGAPVISEHDRRGGGEPVQDPVAPVSASSPTAARGMRVTSSSPPVPTAVPACRRGLAGTSNRVEVLTASSYRNPAALPPGGVLVVGASASGVQIADELSHAGREVAIAVGRHTRMPRRYRGMDSFWWLEATGRLARTIDEMPDTAAARRENSLQLIGRPELDLRGRDLDLGVLQARGVRLLGRLEDVAGAVASFRDDLADTVSEADRRMHHFLDAVDTYVDRAGLSREVLPAVRPRSFDIPHPVTRLDLARERIGTVISAAGYRPDHPWLRVPVLAPDGSIRQRRGVTPAPGLYVVGQYFQHRRDSGFIDGARHDARSVVDHLLGGRASRSSYRDNSGTGCMSSYDVAVVGGRIAGASTALLLARAGVRVVLVDHGRRGSDTVSTHGLMRGGVLQLSRWGILPDVVAADTPPIRNVVFHYADGDDIDVTIRPSVGVDALYAPRRHLLDRLLVDAAAAAGAEVMHQTTATELIRDGADRVTGVRARTPGGAEMSFPASLTIGADGVRSTVATEVKAPMIWRGNTASAFLYRYFTGLPAERLRMGVRRGRGGRADSDQRRHVRLCVRNAGPHALATTQRSRARLRNPSRLGGTGLRRPGSGGQARQPSFADGAALPGYLRRSWGNGWALVGDAGYFKDPITTHGMTDALRDAELLANAVLATLSGCDPASGVHRLRRHSGSAIPRHVRRHRGGSRVRLEPRQGASLAS